MNDQMLTIEEAAAYLARITRGRYWLQSNDGQLMFRRRGYTRSLEWCKYYPLAHLNVDERMKGILEQAARSANAQMRVEALADRRGDRVVWPDRQWQWASLRYENGSFDTINYTDTYARDKWFFQAIAASPAMFKRDPTAGSLYWLGLRDKAGEYLNGSKTYKLTVPLPVPARLFWSVTVYDAETRSQVQTDQQKAALRSLFELKEPGDAKSVELFFGPEAPPGQQKRWIKTIPDKGWFVYFRIYGPENAAFDKSWKPGDFELVK